MRAIYWTVLAVAVIFSNSALGDYRSSKGWFATLTLDERFAVQSNLIMLGLYDGTVDGNYGPKTFDAIGVFQSAHGMKPSGDLTAYYRDQLGVEANRIFTSYGLQLVDDERCLCRLFVPGAITTQVNPLDQGTRYESADGGFVIETLGFGASGLDFAKRFTAPSSLTLNRDVDYSRYDPTWFVVSGMDQGFRFYRKATYESGFYREFVVKWRVPHLDEGRRVSTLAASFFYPLSGNPQIAVEPPAPPPLNPQAPSSDGDGVWIGSIYLPDSLPNAIALAGDITASTPLEFLRALKARPLAKVVILRSNGGLVDPGLIIAHEVRERGLATLVLPEQGCYSACAFVYFAGTARMASGELGVHQVWNDSNDLISGQATLSDVLEALTEFGVQQAVISTMLRTPPKDMHVFSPREITEYVINSGNPVALLAPQPEAKSSSDPQDDLVRGLGDYIAKIMSKPAR